MENTTKHKRRIIISWCMYDWANSVYNLVIASAIFPVYYTSVTTVRAKDGSIINDNVVFWGYTIKNTVLSNYVLSASFLLVCVLSPLLSGIADQKGNRKLFLRFFCYLGALSCAGLSLLTSNPDSLLLTMIFMFFASVGFWNSLVFYNSFLPEITPPSNMDRVSAQGFALGYLGSSILLIICLIFIQVISPQIELEKALATRICFIAVSVWWIVFAQFLFINVPEVSKTKTKTNYMSGFHELNKVYREIKNSVSLNRFLQSFFFISMGVQTVMLVASYFGSKILNMGASQLIPVILIIQFIGIGGSYIFSYISEKKGNKWSLSLSILIWVGVCCGAWWVGITKSTPGFYILAGCVGLVMGGIQSQCRSTYSKLISDKSDDHASFFSFYDVTEKFAMVFGLFFFGLVEQESGNMVNSVLVLIVFFVLGFILLQKLRDNKLYNKKA